MSSQQDVTDARDAVAVGVSVEEAAQPARAGEVTERLMVQTLHGRWSGLSAGALAERVDTGGAMGFRRWIEAMATAKVTAPRETKQ